MKTMTKSYIIEFIKQNGSVRPHDLIEFLGLTPAAVHRQLKKLVDDGLVEKRGKPPRVYYEFVEPFVAPSLPDIGRKQESYLGEHYSYITPVGKVLLGSEAFYQWCVDKKQKKYFLDLMNEYIEVRKKIYKEKKELAIDATFRFQNIFPKIYLKKIYYQDFYSLPKFGKTKLGQMVLHGKQAQNKKMIRDISLECESSLKGIIKIYKIQAIVWAPHSLPRAIPFLKEFSKQIKINKPNIEVVKAYKGEIPIAQKSLSKIEDRIKNARETILIPKQEIKYKRVLVIDDAIGSGATMNEIASKLIDQGVDEVFGYAVVGSYKGFEVIKEV